MVRRISLSLAASALVATCLVASTQSISVDAGWNLVGTSLDVDSVKSNGLGGVTTAWAWDGATQKWEVVANDTATQDKIDALVTSGTMEHLTALSAGDGFWVNTTTSTALSLTGTESAAVKTIAAGWNLVSFEGTSTKSVSDVFAGNDNIYTVWEFTNGAWKAWSPVNAIKNAITASSTVSDLTDIVSSKGYWVNTQIATSIATDLTPPSAALPDFVFVSEVIGDGGQIAALGGVSIYNSVDETYYGTTDLNGKFDLTSLSLDNGTSLKAIKDGYTNTVGTVQNGFVTFSLMKLGGSTAVDMVANGAEKPLKNYGFIASDYATVEVEPSTADQSLTFTVTAYSNPESLPKIVDDILLTNKNGVKVSTTPEEMSVVGAANINLKGSDKKVIVNPSTMDGNLNFNYKLEKFIGDLDSILNGLTDSTNASLTKFNPKALELLETAKTDGLMSFHLIQQQPNGTWIELDEAIPVVEGNKIKLKKATDGNIKTFGSGNIAYIIKTEAVKGSTEICFEQEGYRMNDGSIVTSDSNTDPIYDFINKPVESLVILGDQNVIGQPKPSAETGCTTIEYKVPYLAPMYQITAVSEGNFDKTVVVDVEFGNLNTAFDGNVSIYKIPERATIEGYVKSRVNGDTSTEEGVGKAIVTLQDPQILTKDKVLVDNTNDKKTITLEANPNVTFTYTLKKEDDTTSTVWETGKEIKTGTLDSNSTINVLTQAEVEDIIYGTTEGVNPWLSNPYGNYVIAIKAIHTYAPQTEGGDNLTFTEEILTNFTAKVDETALINAFSFSVSQGEAPYYRDTNKDGVYTDELNISNMDETLATNELGKISIFGGKDISLFKPLVQPIEYDTNGDGEITFADIWIANPDNSKWDTYIFSMDSDLGYDFNGSNSDNPYFAAIEEANAGSSVKIVLEDTFANQYMPFSQVYKMFNDNYSTVVAYDYETVPLYKAGFTVANIYTAEYLNKTDGNFKTFAASYTTLNTDKLNSVDDFSNILDFKVSASEPTAYSARYTKTEDDGFYQINQIAPSVIPTLELTARAEGHEYGIDNERLAGYPSSVNGSTFDGEVNATAGDVLEHNFMLKRFPAPADNNATDTNVTYPDTNLTDMIDDIVPDLPVVNQTFENGLSSIDGNWTVSKLDLNTYYSSSSDTAKWQVVTNTNLPTVNSNWSANYDTNSTILPTPYGEAYAWVGDINTGTYSDTGTLYSNYAVATALNSPVIDFANYSLATLNFKQWFEVSAYDAAFDTAFVGFEIQADDANQAGTKIKLQDAGGYTTYVTVGQTYITRVTPENPVINGYDTTTYLSNNGLNAEPSWSDFKIPLDMLAGQKAKIVFGFFTKDTLFNNNRGWGIDNVFIQDSLDNVLSLPPMIPSLDDNISTDIGIVDTNTTVVPAI